MFRYKVYFEDGSDAGDAAYADNINPGEEILIGVGQRLRVLDVVPIDEDWLRFVGLLKVEPIS